MRWIDEVRLYIIIIILLLFGFFLLFVYMVIEETMIFSHSDFSHTSLKRKRDEKIHK